MAAEKKSILGNPFHFNSSFFSLNNKTFWSMLCLALEKGWTRLALSFVKELRNVDATDKKGETVLHNAAIFGNVEVVKYVIEKGANINAKGHKGATPLLYAARHSRKGVFELLFSAGAKVDECDDNGCSVLFHVSRHMDEWIEVVQSLLKRVPINKKGKDGQTALHIAAYNGRLKIVKCLIEEGADINVRSSSGATPLLYAAAMGHREVTDLLLHAGTNVDFCDGNNCTVLHYALVRGWIEEVQSFVKQVHDLNTKDCNGLTALHKASYFGHLEGVRCLVEEGADINAKTNKGLTPFLYAAMSRRRRNIFDFLLDAGAKVGGCGKSKCTVLHYVSFYGWTDVVQSLVKKALNESDRYGMAAFHSMSVDINARNKKDETALLLACRKGNLAIVEHLLQANASCDIPDGHGNSPLHYLIKMERPSIKHIKLVIENIAVLLPADYDAILNNSLLKMEILQDMKFCCQVIVNKFNNYDLPELYKSSVAGSLPCIEKMKMISLSEVFQTIQQTVRFEIQTIGHCIQLKGHPTALKVLCVKSILEYYDKNTRNVKLVKTAGCFNSETSLVNNTS